MNHVNKNALFLLAFVSLTTLLAGWFISHVNVNTAFLGLLSVILVVLCFLKTEVGLYILIVAMLLGPQFVAGGAQPEFEAVRGRPLTLRLDDFLLLAVGLGWFTRAAIDKELGLFLKTPLNRPIAYYFIACVVSTMVGAMVGRVKPALGFFFVLKYFEYFVIYFMAVNHLREKKQVERFILTILVVCFVVCIIAMTQIPSGARVSAPFEGEGGEPNTLGGYLDLILALVLGLLLTNGMPRYRFFLLLLLPTILIVLMATLSRSSWLSLLPLMLTFLVLSKKKMVLIVSVLFVVLTAPFILPKSVVDRALYTFTQPPEEGQLEVGQLRIDTSTSARIFSWKEVLSKDWVKHPILGYGVTGYRFLDAQFPRVLVETGLLGFFAFILLLRSILKVSHSAYRQTEDPLFRGVALGYLAGFFALLTHAIGANTFIIVRIMEPFWFLTAIVVMTAQIEKPSSPPSTDTV